MFDSGRNCPVTGTATPQRSCPDSREARLAEHALRARENATLLAVIHSYQQNRQVMGQLQQAAMNRVQADAARANQQSAAINARREASTAAFNQHMDNLNAQSQSFNAHMDNIDRSRLRRTTSLIARSFAMPRMAIGPARTTDRSNHNSVTGTSLPSMTPRCPFLVL
jgi:hypothetical protein